MSRWDEKDYEKNSFDGIIDEEQESRLLKTFNDYRSLQIKEVEKRRKIESKNNSHSGTWTFRFMISALVQIFTISSLTIVLATSDMVNSDVNFMEFLSLSMDGSAKLLVFGYTSYLALVIGVSVTGGFYNFLETRLKKKISGSKNILAWFHLVGLNLGGALTVFFLILGGLVGTGITNLGFDVTIGNSLNPFFIGSISLLAVSCLVGVTLYFTLLIKPNQNVLSKSKLFD